MKCNNDSSVYRLVTSFLLFHLFAFSLFVVSCSSDDDVYQSRLKELLLEDMSFTYEGGSQEQVFRHENLSPYSVAATQSWCMPSLDVNNSKLVVSVKANETYDARTDTVTLTDTISKYKRYIIVTQARSTGLFLDKTYLEASMYGDTVTTTLRSNVSYELQIPDSCDWVTKANETSKSRGLDTTAITFYVKENKTYKDREAIITVINKDENLIDKLKIYQPFNTVFSADSTNFEADMYGDTIIVNLETNISYNITIPDSCNWITKKSSSRGVDTKTLTFIIKENKTYHDRNGVITLSNDDAGASIGIKVHQPFTTVFSPDKKHFEASMYGDTVSIKMNSNISYVVTIPDDCDWITHAATQKTRGVEATTILLKVARNNTYHEREAIVTISNKEAGVSESITIIQPFTTTFSVDKNAFDVDMEGGTVTFNLTHNISYDVKIPDGCDWITLPATKTRGKTRAATETTPITLRVKENTSYADREAIVTIGNKEAGVEVKISIYQPFATTFEPDNASFDVAMEGGTVTVNMKSNVSFDVNIPADCDWISMPTAARSKTRAAKTTAVVLRVAENTSYKDRDAVVTISNKAAGVSVGIYIHQAFKPSFTIDKTEAKVPMEGGTVTATIESNVSYDVKIPSDCNWITQTSGSRTRGSKSSVIMFRVAANTTGHDRSATITFSNASAGVSATLTITQPFTSNFNVDGSAIEVDELGGNVGVSVAANVAVTVQPQADWLRVGDKTGVGDGYWTQQIVVSPFTAKTAQRTGNVKFIHAATNESVVVTITQNRTFYISETSITLTEAGQTQALTLQNSASRSVIWTSSDTKVATVNNSGTVTAVAKGKAVITVNSADGKYSDEVNVTVDIPTSTEQSEASSRH